jgi:hypothetical protein
VDDEVSDFHIASRRVVIFQRSNGLILLTILIAPSATLTSCGTKNIEEALTQAPIDCRLSAKLFDWFSLQIKTVSWTKDAGPGEDGTVMIVFTIKNTDFVPHALSNSGSGYLYSVDISLKGGDGILHAATEASGIVAASNTHFAIGRDQSLEGTLKFKVRRDNYFLIFERKFGDKPVGKYDFACPIAVL